ncbi:unnamed protein product [Parnassius apollo]|uniref:(apollo) hypothetical protein n=1 Tax=Parnassius apollo TaxID=110799 RepID=A0A8S3YH74_PARAO|nr:unnamed protein product [Parnassius apollo]
MKASSDKSLPPTSIAEYIIPIPDVDKRRGDLRNIIGVILQRNNEGIYKVGTKHGVLQNLYCRTEFDICIQKFLKVGWVKQDMEISLRTIAAKYSVGSGQGFVRCSCVMNFLRNR